MNIKKVLQSLIRFFEREEIDYALIGAFALTVYGYTRATQDVDFLARRTDQERIVLFLESLGYETLHRSDGFSNHLHSLPNLGRIDFVYAEGDTAEVVLSEARRLLILADVSLPVVRAEHLVALKLFSIINDPERIYRDMADIQHLMKTPDLDMEEVRGYFEKYGLLERYCELTGESKTDPQL